MLSLEDIKAAHAKVKSGADFPAYVQDLVKLGVTGYETFVSDGHVLYHTAAELQLQSLPKYESLLISDSSDAASFRAHLKNHQLGHSDYLTFCQQAAETGIEKWVVDTGEMSCTYYDKADNEILTERIPAP